MKAAPTHDFKVALFERHKCGDENATRLLVESVKGTVSKIAARYKWSSIDWEDLISQGNVGVLKALQNYDPSMGDFATFAWRFIQGELNKCAMSGAHAVYIPQSKIERKIHFKLRIRVQKLEAEGFDFESAIEKASHELGVDPERARKSLAIRNADQFCTVRDRFLDETEEQDAALTLDAARVALADAMTLLTDVERTIVQ